MFRGGSSVKPIGLQTLIIFSSRDDSVNGLSAGLKVPSSGQTNIIIMSGQSLINGRRLTCGHRLNSGRINIITMIKK